MNPVGSVVSLHVAPTGAAAMQTVDEVQVVTGLGTYSNNPGTGRHVTLIEIEAIEGLQREYGVEVAPAQSRRNIVTRNVALNHLVERTFRVGAVVLRGMRLCEPCAHFERLSTRGAMRGLIHRGGLRADIITGGTIRTGDAIVAVESERS